MPSFLQSKARCYEVILCSPTCLARLAPDASRGGGGCKFPPGQGAVRLSGVVSLPGRRDECGLDSLEPRLKANRAGNAHVRDVARHDRLPGEGSLRRAGVYGRERKTDAPFQRRQSGHRAPTFRVDARLRDRWRLAATFRRRSSGRSCGTALSLADARARARARGRAADRARVGADLRHFGNADGAHL